MISSRVNPALAFTFPASLSPRRPPLFASPRSWESPSPLSLRACLTRWCALWSPVCALDRAHQDVGDPAGRARGGGLRAGAVLPRGLGRVRLAARRVGGAAPAGAATCSLCLGPDPKSCPSNQPLVPRAFCWCITLVTIVDLRGHPVIPTGACCVPCGGGRWARRWSRPRRGSSCCPSACGSR
jgi:hypothetical protein